VFKRIINRTVVRWHLKWGQVNFCGQTGKLGF
jgi:hypothetical protein